MTEQERFEKFTKELAGLTLKYGIVLESFGGVSIYEENELKDIIYSDDSTSGDLLAISMTI